MPLRVAAGDPPCTLMPGQVARIFTGAPVPTGADTVLMQEDCEIADGRVRLPGRDGVTQGQNIRPAGQDARRDAIVIERGQRLTPQAVGLIASVGVPQVTVSAPRVLILTSGDELQRADESPLPGKIYDSNGPQLEQLVVQSGFPSVQREHLPDDPAIISDTLTRYLTDASQRPDVIISTGGVSVGEEITCVRCWRPRARWTSGGWQSNRASRLPLARSMGFLSLGCRVTPLPCWSVT